MLFSNGFAILSNATTAFVCISIMLVTLSQLKQDKKSLSLARLMFIFGALTALTVLMRFSALAGQPIHTIFMPITMLTMALPYGMLTFAIDFFGVYRRWRRWVVLLQFFAIAVVTVGCFVEITFRIPVIFTNVTISPNGLVLYDYPIPSLNYFLIGCAYAGFAVAVQTTVSEYWKARNRTNRQMLIGMSCLAVGIFIVPLPMIDKYAFEQIFYTTGSLILIVSTLRHRLFDPISQYNAALENRAERLALIQRVGQRANRRLEVQQLLQDVVREIQQQFHYHAVTLYLSNGDDQGYSRVRADADRPEWCFIELPRQVEYLATLTPADRARIGTVDKDTQSLLCLPIQFGESSREPRWIGALALRSTQPNGFSAIDREVLQILAQQLAVSIRNAQLFEELQQANAAKSDFIGYISHEVRNPLATIDNTIDSMLNYPQFYGGIGLPAVFHEDAVAINRNAKHLKQLLTDVLDFEKIDAGKMELRIERIDPLPILQDVWQNGITLAKPGVEVRILYDNNLPFILADSTRLRQVLLNIVSNASKYTERGQITLDAKVNGRMLEFIVIDTGFGITEEVLARLFQPYAQGNRDLARKYGGTGLGLSISRRLVELQGGSIEARSRANDGTTICFTIPLAENARIAHLNSK